MENKSKKITVGKVFKTTLNIIFPFKSVKNSATVFIRTTQNNIKNAENIKNMASDLYESTKIKTVRNDSFEAALKNSKLSIDQLINIFKRKKNIYLIALYSLCFLTTISIIHSFIIISKNIFLLSCLSLISLFCILFLLAFGCQFRLWQLRVRRLSIEEKGGIRDFMRESSYFFSSLKFETDFSNGVNKNEKIN